MERYILVKVYHATMFSGPDVHLADNCSRSLFTYIIRISSCSLNAFSEKA